MQRRSSHTTITRMLVSLLAIALLLGGIGSAQQKQHQGTPGEFDYYLLNLSWAPAFCASHSTGKSSSECDPVHHYGFIVHGLWPQNESGPYPENCGSASPVSHSIVRQMLPIMPSSGLIQHEWARHGTCSGLSAQDYFSTMSKVFHQIQIPQEYRAPAQTISASPSEVEQKFAAANHAPAGSFRVVCSRSELDVEVCLTRDLQFRQCAPNLRDCRADRVRFPPVP